MTDNWPSSVIRDFLKIIDPDFESFNLYSKNIKNICHQNESIKIIKFENDNLNKEKTYIFKKRGTLMR